MVEEWVREPGGREMVGSWGELAGEWEWGVNGQSLDWQSGRD